MKLNQKNEKNAVAKVEAYAAMLMKDECKKGIEREDCQFFFNKLKINYEQESIEMKKKQIEIFVLEKDYKH